MILIIDDEDAKGLLYDLRQEREHCQEEMEELTGGPLANYRIRPSAARVLREKVVDIIDTAGPRQKREFFRRFIGKIEVDGAHARIHYHTLNLTAHLAGGGSFSVGGLASPTGFEPVSPA